MSVWSSPRTTTHQVFMTFFFKKGGGNCPPSPPLATPLNTSRYATSSIAKSSVDMSRSVGFVVTNTHVRNCCESVACRVVVFAALGQSPCCDRRSWLLISPFFPTVPYNAIVTSDLPLDVARNGGYAVW